jgi:REP element-mobilizing transposase RayT
MTRKKPIAAVVKQVKGSTSRYINKEQLIDQPFAWQRGYAVFSVSEQALDRLYKYIRDQKKHHSRESYNNEIAILRARK